MNCSELELELEQLVETRQSRLSEAAALHVDGCSDCRRRWQDHQLIDSAIGALPHVSPPEWLAQSVVKALLGDHSTPSVRIHHQTSPPVASRSNQWVVMIVSAACLFAAIGIGLLSSNQNDRVAVNRVPRRTSVNSPIEVASSVSAVIEDLRAEYRELAVETSATARDLAAVLPPAVKAVWKSNEFVEQQPEQTPSGSGGTAASAGTMKTIGRSFSDQIGQAMDFLWATVPESVSRG